MDEKNEQNERSQYNVTRFWNKKNEINAINDCAIK